MPVEARENSCPPRDFVAHPTCTPHRPRPRGGSSRPILPILPRLASASLSLASAPSMRRSSRTSPAQKGAGDNAPSRDGHVKQGRPLRSVCPANGSDMEGPSSVLSSAVPLRDTGTRKARQRPRQEKIAVPQRQRQAALLQVRVRSRAQGCISILRLRLRDAWSRLARHGAAHNSTYLLYLHSYGPKPRTIGNARRLCSYPSFDALCGISP